MIEHCDKIACRKCWLAWLTTGEPPKEEGPSDKRTAPDEEGLHPNLVEHFRKRQQVEMEMEHILGPSPFLTKD